MKALLNLAGYTAGILGIAMMAAGKALADIADDIFIIINKEKNNG